MGTRKNEKPSHATTMLYAAFDEACNQFRQNVETAHKMRADIAELRQKFKAERDATYAGLKEQRALQEGFNRHLAAVDHPSIIIGRQLPDGQTIVDTVPPKLAGSPAILPEDLYLFLLALIDLEGKRYIDELQHALQQQDLKQLEQRIRHRKSWLPPESN